MVKGEVKVCQEVVHTESEGETSEGNTGVVSKTVSEEKGRRRGVRGYTESHSKTMNKDCERGSEAKTGTG